jgi:hypothetical protein
VVIVTVLIHWFWFSSSFFFHPTPFFLKVVHILFNLQFSIFNFLFYLSYHFSIMGFLLKMRSKRSTCGLSARPQKKLDHARISYASSQKCPQNGMIPSRVMNPQQ